MTNWNSLLTKDGAVTDEYTRLYVFTTTIQVISCTPKT